MECNFLNFNENKVYQLCFFMVCLFGITIKIPSPNVRSSHFLRIISCEGRSLFFILKTTVHFEFIFVKGIRSKFRLILVNEDAHSNTYF